MSRNILSNLTRPRKKNLAYTASFMIPEDFFSKSIEHFVFHLSNLQYIAILIQIQAIPFWNEDDNLISRKLLDIFTLTNFVNNSFSSHVYSVVLVLSWFYFITLISLLAFYGAKLYMESLKGTQNQKNFFHILFLLHFSVMSYFTNTIYMAPWYVQNEFKHIYLRIPIDLVSKINLSVIVLNCLVTGIFACLCFNPFKGIYSCRTPIFQLLIFFSKTFIGFVIPFLHQDRLEIQIMLSILVFISSGWKLWLLYTTIPYHTQLAMKAAVIWTSMELSLSFLNLLSQLFSNNILQGGIITVTYLDLMLITIVVKFALVRFDYKVRKYMGTKGSDPISESEAFKIIWSSNLISRNLRWALIKNGDFNVYEAYFFANVIDHSIGCQEEDCFCNYLSKERSFYPFNNTKESLKKFLKRRAVEFLKKSIDNIKENNELRIALASYILDQGEQSKNLILALTNLLSICDHSSSFFVKVKKEILLKRIQAKLDSLFVNLEDTEELDMKRFVDFQIHRVEFTEKLIFNTNKYLDFWLSYQKPTVQLSEIIQKGVSIEEEADKIDTLWSSNIKRHPEFSLEMKDAYCVYLELVRNAPWRAKRMFKRFFHANMMQIDKSRNDNYITKDNLFLSDTLILSAPILNGRLGVLDYVSENSLSLLGYKHEELIGKNINVLLTPFFARLHNAMLNDHSQQGRLPGNRGLKSMNGYIKTKTGYVLPCSLYLTVFPYVQNHISYMVVARVSEQKEDFLILTEDGAIEGFSKGLDKVLNLSSSGRTNITDICMNITSTKETPSVITSPGKAPRILSNIREERESESLDSLKVLNEKNVALSEIEATGSYREAREIILKDLKFMSQKGKFESWELSKMSSDLWIEMRTLLENKFYIVNFKQKMEKKALTSPKTIHIETSQLNLKIKHKIMRNDHSSNFTELDFERKLPLNTVGSVEVNMLELNTPQSKLLPDVKLESKKEDRLQKMAVSITSSTTRVFSEFEEAVYAVPKENFSIYRSIFLGTFSVVCIILLIILVVYSNGELELIKKNFKIFRTSSQRILRIIETKRAAEGVYILKRGLVTPTRYDSYKVAPTLALLKVSFMSGRDLLDKMNDELRVNLNQTDSSLHRKFYSNLVPLVINDSKVTTLYRNTFDAARDIVSRADTVLANFALSLTILEDENLNFIRRNSFNELLLTSEQISNTVVEDIHLKFGDIRNLSLAILVITFFFISILMILFVFKQLERIKDRNHFIDIFLRISENQVNEVIKQVRRFKASLDQFNIKAQGLRYEDFDFSSNSNQNTSEEFKQGSKGRRRHASKKGINNKQWIIFIMRILLFALVGIPFVTFFALLVTKEEGIKSNLETIVEINTNMYESVLLTVSFYDYIETGGATLLRNRPIGEEWEAIYQRSTKMQTFFSNLLVSNSFEQTSCDPSLMKMLEGVVYGNLCELLPPQRLQPICIVLANGLVRKGIQTLTNYYLYTLRDLKDNYDSSGKTLSDARRILKSQNLIHIELFLAQWLYAGYVTVTDVVESCTLENINSIQRYFILVFGLYIGFCAVGTFILFILLKKFIEEERVAWRKIFRKIPIQIISSSKPLKNYLAKEFRDDSKSS